MSREFPVTAVKSTRIAEVDFDDLAFGSVFSDHMFSMRYRDGEWREPEVLPYGPVTVDPSNATLHYGQTVFEGLKAFKGPDGAIRIFRPDMNAKRLQESCRRLCIPELDEEVFHDAIEALLRLDHAWIPRKRGQALYIRPLIFSDESHLEVRPSDCFRFLIMTAPVRAYFEDDMAAVGLKVEETYTRSAPGGIGYAKTAGNYAASLYPGAKAREEGYAQVLWLDGVEHRYVEEVGAMNIFFRFGDTVVTPSLHGTILPGITRDSVITLLAESGLRVEERRISIDELIEGIRSGSLSEAFGAGTAAIIAPVGRFAYKGEVHVINDERAGETTRTLFDQITRIQLGETNDEHGWNRVIPGRLTPRMSYGAAIVAVAVRGGWVWSSWVPL